jgi:hypothetical protein
MRSDSEIKSNGFRILFSQMDNIEAEKFISLIKRDNFDYTKWRQDLFEELSIEEISSKAMDFVNKFRGKRD